MITTVRPMSVDHAHCLAMAYELHRLLGELNDSPENGEGSAFESAQALVDEVIAHLEPSEFDGAEPGPACWDRSSPGTTLLGDEAVAVVSRRWIECRVCGEGFSPRTFKQDVCGLVCFCRDRRHLVGYPTRARQAQRQRGDDALLRVG